jgi:hypothetical protein
MLHATYVKPYKKRNADGSKKTMFQYRVTSDQKGEAGAKEMAEFKQSRGQYYLEDKTSGAVLWNDSKFVGKTASLEKLHGGEGYFLNTENIDIACSLAKQAPELAGAFASQLMSQINIATVATTAEVETEETAGVDKV